ncbi:MAG: UDP diphospho-muramoyl pentapeptide beta-N acetylglucosaminyl transferase [Parcubacteria group bacterium GW2011_GWA1_43_21]|nr:MAG: UDP diphospho-muramoyl pentapeptide beta-N acetylglucosaminyl transferase [Parcubacteria group bacterium GW2011_GWA1_43_21]
MKILFTGGGTGGHFYPIIAIAQEIKKITEKEKLLAPELFFMSVNPYNEELLFANDITFVKITAGKWRRYFSWRNFSDLFKTAYGVWEAIIKLYRIYPDLVFCKGGFSSFPPVLAARILRIPIFVHESDSHPGRVNTWAGKFADRVAVSYHDALKYFPAVHTAVTGNPLREEILNPNQAGALEFLGLEADRPIIMVVGGSQGAVKINNTIIDILPELLKKYQIIHQTGAKNFDEAEIAIKATVDPELVKKNYRPFPYLSSSAMKMSASASSLIISRAGSAIFEIAYWGVPAIIIPLPETISHDQTSNAFAYARSGSAIVIEENNLTPSVLLSEIDRILNNPKIQIEMKEACQTFAKPRASHTIATDRDRWNFFKTIV